MKLFVIAKHQHIERHSKAEDVGTAIIMSVMTLWRRNYQRE